MDGEVAAFVRVYMQAAEAQLLVTKQLLGNAVCRVALGSKGSRRPTGSETSSTPGFLFKPQPTRHSLTFKDCGQPEEILDGSDVKDGRVESDVWPCDSIYFGHVDKGRTGRQLQNAATYRLRLVRDRVDCGGTLRLPTVMA